MVVSAPDVSNTTAHIIALMLIVHSEFAQGKVDPVQAGKEGGLTQPEQHKPTENDGKKVTGEPDPRVKGN